MSREHIYKAKRVNWREFPKEEWWVEGALFEGKENSYIFTNVKVTDKWENSEIRLDAIGYLIDSKTACQYQGLTDKNGRKIFDRDIVKYFIRNDSYGKPLYEYGELICDASKEIFFFTLNFKYGFGNIAQEDIEVIGNIFDNPELLEGGKAE